MKVILNKDKDQVTSVAGKKGDVSLSKSDVGLGNVDNTADANKSVAYAANAGTVNNLTVQTAVPANAKFTDTTYSAATQSAAGLMSAADKTKLDGVAAGANNYSLPAATTSARGGVVVGNNITVSGGTISLTKANVTNALGYTPPTSDTNTWRPLGTTADTACAGNDSRLSNARTPTAHNHSASNITSGTLAVERGGTGQTSIAGLKSALGISGGLTVVESTYVGTGKSGSTSNSLTFSTRPKFIYISGYTGSIISGTIDSGYGMAVGASGYRGPEFTWQSNTVSWHSYDGSSLIQLNVAGSTYHVYAFY